MKNALAILSLCLLSLTACAQAQPKPEKASPDTKNTVFVKEGQVFIQSVTTNTIPTDAATIEARIEKLKQQEQDILAQLEKLRDGIKELLSLKYDVEKAEKKLQKASSPLPPTDSDKKN